MARTLESLRKTEVFRFPLAEKVALPRPFRPDIAVPTPNEPADEIPFIEVGGKNLPIEASPSVLAGGNSDKLPKAGAALPQERDLPRAGPWPPRKPYHRADSAIIAP